MWDTSTIIIIIIIGPIESILSKTGSNSSPVSHLFLHLPCENLYLAGEAEDQTWDTGHAKHMLCRQATALPFCINIEYLYRTNSEHYINSNDYDYSFTPFYPTFTSALGSRHRLLASLAQQRCLLTHLAGTHFG